MPEKIGQYPVVSQLGRGGMGIVYKARDEKLNRFVAIKVLNEQLAEDATLLQRFVREAQAAAGLSHPNIVQIFYIGEDNGHPYFVMEYVSGRSLDQMLREEGRIENPRASQMILQAAHGLAAAHDKGIIHRDIKPANLILDDRGILKIADFGLALPADAQTQLTATGMFVGTPGYLAPEQVAAEKVDNRTDIYALGVSFYLLLTGTPPFKGDSPLALVRSIMDTEPADVATLNPKVDATTRRILGKMIAKDRTQRYQSCHELVADLEEYLATSGVRSVTAGLSRTVSPEVAAAAAAPTQVLPTPAQAAPPTIPQAPLIAPPTQPNMAPPPPQQRSTSRAAIAAIVVVIALLVGGGIAAAVLGTKFIRSWQQSRVQTSSSTAPQTTTPTTSAAATAPKDGVMLLQTVKPSPAATETVTPDPATAAPPNKAEGTPATATAAVSAAPPARTAQAAPASRQATVAEKPRSRSGVAVAATGDQGLTGAVSSVVRSELEGAGIEVIDAQTLPATEDLLRGGDVSAARLIDRLGREGYAVLVLARVDATGQRELSYYGRHDVAYSSRVTVTAYDLATGRPLGASKSATIEYTSLNAESQSEDAVGPLAKSIAATIRSR